MDFLSSQVLFIPTPFSRMFSLPGQYCYIDLPPYHVVLPVPSFSRMFPYKDNIVVLTFHLPYFCTYIFFRSHVFLPGQYCYIDLLTFFISSYFYTYTFFLPYVTTPRQYCYIDLLPSPIIFYLYFFFLPHVSLPGQYCHIYLLSSLIFF